MSFEDDIILSLSHSRTFSQKGVRKGIFKTFSRWIPFYNLISVHFKLPKKNII